MDTFLRYARLRVCAVDNMERPGPVLLQVEFSASIDTKAAPRVDSIDIQQVMLDMSYEVPPALNRLFERWHVGTAAWNMHGLYSLHYATVEDRKLRDGFVAELKKPDGFLELLAGCMLGSARRIVLLRVDWPRFRRWKPVLLDARSSLNLTQREQ